MLPAPDQWQDLNHCKRFGSMEAIPLKMYQLDRAHPERLAIGMAPWLTFSKLWIIATDYENYSLVGDPNRKVRLSLFCFPSATVTVGIPCRLSGSTAGILESRVRFTRT